MGTEDGLCGLHRKDIERILLNVAGGWLVDVDLSRQNKMKNNGNGTFLDTSQK